MLYPHILVNVWASTMDYGRARALDAPLLLRIFSLTSSGSTHYIN